MYNKNVFLFVLLYTHLQNLDESAYLEWHTQKVLGWKGLGRNRYGDDNIYHIYQRSTIKPTKSKPKSKHHINDTVKPNLQQKHDANDIDTIEQQSTVNYFFFRFRMMCTI